MILTKKEKKFCKKLVRKILAQKQPQQEMDSAILIHRSDGQYDWESHAFLIATNSEEDALKKLERRYPVHGLECSPSMYDCTGEAFCDPATVKRVANERYLVNLYINYDL